MIFADDAVIKIDSVILPGLLKSIEIKGDAQVDEQEVEGKSKKPKQATGYEDSKINIELILEDDDKMTRLDKLVTIQQLFKRAGQEKPELHQIISEDIALRGISQVIFKSMTHKAENKKQQIAVTLEFWEYTAMTITASKSASNSKSSAKSSAKTADSNLTKEYQNYLTTRGSSPKLQKTPAQDSGASTSSYVEKAHAIMQ